MKARSLRRLIPITLAMLVAGCAVPQALVPMPTSTLEPTPIAVAPTRPSSGQTVPPPTNTSQPTAPPTTTPLPSSTPAPPTVSPPVPSTAEGAEPLAFISQTSLFAYLEDLTAIQPHSGWRNSATEGEREALDYVEKTLDEFEYLKGLGLTVERQSFRVFLATELWETRLHLTVNDQEIEVPADGLRGPRDDIGRALQFDSDGKINDSNRDPVVVTGPIVLVRTAAEIDALDRADVQGKIVFLDYAAVDYRLLGTQKHAELVSDLMAKEPAGLVLVSSFSNKQGKSHGVGSEAFDQVTAKPMVPTVHVRLEDLSPAGIEGWDDFARIAAARLTWDADVFSPAPSGNLVARIPGKDPSQAMILGAHIDSPNCPGAMDDGSGSVVLLEVARVLNVARVQPPADLYLVWFGSEELGLYGSYHFASTHQDLLDRTQAMLNIDCLTHPLDGVDAELDLVTWSYGRLGDNRLTWPDYLAQKAEQWRVSAYPWNYYGIESDSTAFAGFDVPHANLIYMPNLGQTKYSSVHYVGHLHSPYDTVELARKEGNVLAQMARVALMAALYTGQDDPTLRVAPQPDRRAVFVASHTEPVHMSPTTFTDMGLALAWKGFDVDLIPYGQPVTAADLKDADLVIVLPVVDYPSPDGDATLYDEAWSPAEIAALEAYAADSGLLVLTNSAHRLKYNNRVQDPNEDRADANPLAERFGVTYQEGTLAGTRAQTEGTHPLVKGLTALELAEGNGVPFRVTGGQVLARVNDEPAIALVDVGSAGGQVLILADVGMLGAAGEPTNLAFWINLADYARSR